MAALDLDRPSINQEAADAAAYVHDDATVALFKTNSHNLFGYSAARMDAP